MFASPASAYPCVVPLAQEVEPRAKATIGPSTGIEAGVGVDVGSAPGLAEDESPFLFEGEFHAPLQTPQPSLRQTKPCSNLANLVRLGPIPQK